MTESTFLPPSEPTAPVASPTREDILQMIGSTPSGQPIDCTGLDLHKIDLTGANLRGARFCRANLCGSILMDADLHGANLMDANLRGANLSGADLSGADLRSADLVGADLTYAELIEANLSGANLSEARLDEANLSGANLSRTLLVAAQVATANLDHADLSTAEFATVPPPASIWRRGFAFGADVFILGIFAQALALVFSSLLVNLGPYGRPIGLLFVLPYFGVLNSRIGGGQTIGKRLMKIAVRNKDNQPIPLSRSLVRVILISLPVLFNRWELPLLENVVIGWIVSILVFGLGGALLYTMLFNVAARQGLHDLLLGTYVVHLRGKPIASFPQSAFLHSVVAAVLAGIAAIATILMSLNAASLISGSSLAPVMGLYNILKNDPSNFTVGVSDRSESTNGGPYRRSLVITAWRKGRVDGDMSQAVEAIARTSIENVAGIDDYDAMQIVLRSGYDIWLATGNYSTSDTRTIAEWRKQVMPPDPAAMLEGAAITPVIDGFMRTMVRRDTWSARDLFSSRSRRKYPVEALTKLLDFQNLALFDGYRSVSMDTIALASATSSDPDAPQGLVAHVTGKIEYSGNIAGTFRAVLEKEAESWRIYDVNITIPPAKIKARP